MSRKRNLRRILLALVVGAVFLCPGLARAQTAYESYVQTALSPVVFWYETESSGTTIVNHGSGGSAYDMTTHNSPTLGQAGVNSNRGTSILWASASSQYASVNKNDTGSGPADFNTDRSWVIWVKAVSATQIFASVANAESGSQNDRTARMGWTTGPIFFFTIWQDPGTTAYIQQVSTTTLSAGTWYMITGTWKQSTTTMTVYYNATADGNTSTTSGATPKNAAFIGLGRSEGDDTSYFNSNSMDWFIVSSTLSAAQVLAIYNRGISTANTRAWPFTVKRDLKTKKLVNFGPHLDPWIVDVPGFIADKMNMAAIKVPSQYKRGQYDQ